MSRLLKIKLDLPEFEKELNINITIKKDGEVVYTASSPSSNVEMIDEGEKEKKTDTPAPTKNPKKTTKKKSGNFMDLDL